MLGEIYDHLPYVNFVLAGYDALWMVVIFLRRHDELDPLGGKWYALGSIFFMVGVAIGTAFRYHQGFITATPGTPFITVGFILFIVGQSVVISEFRSRREIDASASAH